MSEFYICISFIIKDKVRRTNTREKGSGRPRTMFLDWLLKTEEDNISYNELKMLARDSEDGNLPYRQNTTATAAAFGTNLM